MLKLKKNKIHFACISSSVEVDIILVGPNVYKVYWSLFCHLHSVAFVHKTVQLCCTNVEVEPSSPFRSVSGWHSLQNCRDTIASLPCKSTAKIQFQLKEYNYVVERSGLTRDYDRISDRKHDCLPEVMNGSDTLRPHSKHTYVVKIGRYFRWWVRSTHVFLKAIHALWYVLNSVNVWFLNSVKMRFASMSEWDILT